MMGHALESCRSFSSMVLGNQICSHEDSLGGGGVCGLLANLVEKEQFCLKKQM